MRVRDLKILKLKMTHVVRLSKLKVCALKFLEKRICSLGSETTAVENEFAADWGSSKNSPKNAGGIRQLSLRRVGEALASGLGILSKWHSSSHTRD